MTYRMRTRGATTGAVTGRSRSWRSGQTIEAPPGEFSHLAKDSYEVEEEVETATRVPEREVAASPGLTKHAKGGGWWEVRKGDEVVFKKQSEEAADDYIEEHS